MPQDYNPIDGSIAHSPIFSDDVSLLPYVLAWRDLEYLKNKPLIRKLLGRFPWSSNEQAIKVRRESISPSPIKRQIPAPNNALDGSVPKVDTINVRRMVTEAVPYRHRFESATFRWQESYNQKFPKNIMKCRDDIMDKESIFDEQYNLGQIWYNCLNIYVAGVGWINSNAAADNSIKSADWVATNITQRAGVSSTEDFLNIACEMHDNQRVRFFSGSDYNQEGIAGGTYALLASSEFQLQRTFDTFLGNNRPLNANIVGDLWKDTPFGMYTWKTWSMPFRFKQDGTMVAPEITEAGPDAPNKGETVPNPDYTSRAVSQWEIALILGKDVGDTIEFGPPPSEFAGNSATKTLLTMDWNGKVRMNGLFLVEAPNEDGNMVQTINPGGYLQRFEAEVIGGYCPVQRRAAVAYAYKRKLGR